LACELRIVLTGCAWRDLRRLDPPVAARILDALTRFVDKGILPMAREHSDGRRSPPDRRGHKRLHAVARSRSRIGRSSRASSGSYKTARGGKTCRNGFPRQVPAGDACGISWPTKLACTRSCFQGPSNSPVCKARRSFWSHEASRRFGGHCGA
jgi:hypothetical protein